MLYGAGSVAQLALAKWLGWTAVPLWLSYVLLATATALPALALSALPLWRRIGGAARGAEWRPAAIHGDEEGVWGTEPHAAAVSDDDADEAISLVKATASLRAAKGIMVAPAFWALCGHGAFAITLSSFVLSTIGSLMAHHGANAAQVATSRSVAAILVAAASPISLVPGFLLGRMGARRGIVASALLSAGIIALVVVLYAATTLFGMGFEWQYLTLAAVLAWRMLGLGVINTSVPMLFGDTHADGVGAALGALLSIAGIASMAFAAVVTRMVHRTPSAFTGVMLGTGCVACAAQLLLARMASRLTAAEDGAADEKFLQH
jgi:hypothetical protein